MSATTLLCECLIVSRDTRLVIFRNLLSFVTFYYRVLRSWQGDQAAGSGREIGSQIWQQRRQKAPQKLLPCIPCHPRPPPPPSVLIDQVETSAA